MKIIEIVSLWINAWIMEENAPYVSPCLFRLFYLSACFFSLIHGFFKFSSSLCRLFSCLSGSPCVAHHWCFTQCRLLGMIPPRNKQDDKINCFFPLRCYDHGVAPSLSFVWRRWDSRTFLRAVTSPLFIWDYCNIIQRVKKDHKERRLWEVKILTEEKKMRVWRDRPVQLERWQVHSWAEESNATAGKEMSGSFSDWGGQGKARADGRVGLGLEKLMPDILATGRWITKQVPPSVACDLKESWR